MLPLSSQTLVRFANVAILNVALASSGIHYNATRPRPALPAYAQTQPSPLLRLRLCCLVFINCHICLQVFFVNSILGVLVHSFLKTFSYLFLEDIFNQCCALMLSERAWKSQSGRRCKQVGRRVSDAGARFWKRRGEPIEPLSNSRLLDRTVITNYDMRAQASGNHAHETNQRTFFILRPCLQ